MQRKKHILCIPHGYTTMLWNFLVWFQNNCFVTSYNCMSIHKLTISIPISIIDCCMYFHDVSIVSIRGPNTYMFAVCIDKPTLLRSFFQTQAVSHFVSFSWTASNMFFKGYPLEAMTAPKTKKTETSVYIYPGPDCIVSAF